MIEYSIIYKEHGEVLQVLEVYIYQTNKFLKKRARQLKAYRLYFHSLEEMNDYLLERGGMR